MMAAVLLGAMLVGRPAEAAAKADEGLAPKALRCESKADPLGIDERQPRLSWIVESAARAQKQTAYQILAAASAAALKGGTGDLWDSGKMTGDAATVVVYGGKPLASHQRIYWKVRVWDRDGKPSEWSAAARWSMGLLEPGDWKAEWIGYDKERPEVPSEARHPAQGNPWGSSRKDEPLFLSPPPFLRTEFTAKKKVTQTTLYASALGLVDMYLNGKRVTEDRFTPGWTDYTKRVYYRAYDVMPLIRRGGNALGAVLADGWYNGYLGPQRRRNHYGEQPRLRAQLYLEFADGTTQDVATGGDWKAAYGPVREADFQMGEVYDARLATAWDQPGFDDAKWAAVATGAEMHPLMQGHPGVPVRPFCEIMPVKITEFRPGIYVLDMGQNFAGVFRLRVAGKAGQKITLRFAEGLNPDGALYTNNLRVVRATDTYICAGQGEETWEPRFTFHGYQHVEVSGLTGKPAKDTVVGLPLSSDTPETGGFECSDAMLNRLARNIYFTQRANYIEIPTDCPQRDERLGWTGDAQVYVRAATQITDVQAFFTKWLVDLEDAQLPNGEFTLVAPAKIATGGGGPAWADAGVICP
jgi:alpha-L-rhamnosidase